MSDGPLKQKSLDFALEVVKTYKLLAHEKREYVMAKQFLRSGTGIGALVREAEQGESKADFIHKLSISLKEANETDYWITLLYKSDYLDKSQFSNLSNSIRELLRLLTSIIKSSKANPRGVKK